MGKRELYLKISSITFPYVCAWEKLHCLFFSGNQVLLSQPRKLALNFWCLKACHICHSIEDITQGLWVNSEVIIFSSTFDLHERGMVCGLL